MFNLICDFTQPLFHSVSHRLQLPRILLIHPRHPDWLNQLLPVFLDCGDFVPLVRHDDIGQNEGCFSHIALEADIDMHDALGQGANIGLQAQV